MGRWQRTLKQPLRFAGPGLHTGTHATLCVLPAPPNTGILFRANSLVPALIANVHARRSQLCTQLVANGTTVSTIEHLMAALVAARITNACVDFEGIHAYRASVELPVLDGSSVEYMEGIQHVGIEEQPNAVLSYLRIKKPVQVLKKDKGAWLLPMPEDLSRAALTFQAPTLHMAVQVNFEHKHLGSTFYRFTLESDPESTIDAFNRELAPARTFTFEEEIQWMRANGFARGGSLENAVVFSKTRRTATSQPTVLNRDGLRFPDEWTRHKMLDCIGDISLAGFPLHGYFFATNPGHALTHDLIRELLKDPTNYDKVS